MIFNKVKAGALQLTTFIVVVIALLLAAFIILIHTHKIFNAQTDFVKQTINNTDKGMNYALHNKLQLNDTTLVNLQDKDFKTLKLHRDYWGIFEKVTAVSNIKNKTFKKIALVGASQPDTDRTALYLEEQNRPLVLVGNTKIEGKVYLPKQGVRTGNISGHSYYGNQLIYGNTRTSQSLPKLQSETLKQIENIYNAYKTIGSDQFLDLSIKKRTYRNSFYKPLQVIYDREAINLSEVSLTGHILIRSEFKIIVDATSNLKDVVLVAPIIYIRNNVEGRFQAFATKEITVGNNCKLDYPSALVLEEKTPIIEDTTNPKETPFIKINKGSIMKGSITYLGTTKNYKTQILIDEQTTIIGEVYCNRDLELLGSVYGSVFTSGFVANQSGSVYQNHIYNGAIIVNNLAEEYVGLPFESSKKNVAKWLY